ncbi:MAG: VOC family protein [Gordonia sp. (in: high G+C Gram-positive bacteria)]
MNKTSAITFFYYPDIEPAARFYEDVLGLELVLDQGLARIYRVAGVAYFGIVDGTKGRLPHQERSAALLTIVSDDVEQWHERLAELGVADLSEILHGVYCDHFFFADPWGYAIEIQRFRDPEIAKLF